MAPAMNGLPVSTSTSPSSVANALTLASDATKAIPSPTSAISCAGNRGLCSSTVASPCHNCSASPRTSMAMG